MLWLVAIAFALGFSLIVAGFALGYYAPISTVLLTMLSGYAFICLGIAIMILMAVGHLIDAVLSSFTG